MRRPDEDRGSALVLAIFVLVLLTGMGTALLFLSRNEARMGQAGLRVKKAFYLAESGLEDGRVTLFNVNGPGSFDDDLATAAGLNGVIDFDPIAVQPVYDSAGNVTGFSGVGDDVPIAALTTLGTTDDPGWYAAFLSNDAIEGSDEIDDDNKRVTISGVGGGRERSVEVVQAIIRPTILIPEVPAAAITMLGPVPFFDNGMSNAQSHTGDDCGATGGMFAPIVGAIGSTSTSTVQTAMNRPDDFSSGPLPYVGEDTVGDLTNASDPIVAASGHGTIDPFWLDCIALRELMLELALNADYFCDTDVETCSIPATTASSVTFIDGDLAQTPSGPNYGVLAITGKLVYKGNTGWDGIILAIGEGFILRNGGGGGNPSGAVVMANIDPTPDGLNADKSDWCATLPGFGQAHYDTTGGGNSTVEWCTTNIEASNSIRNYRVVEFLQR